MKLKPFCSCSDAHFCIHCGKQNPEAGWEDVVDKEAVDQY